MPNLKVAVTGVHAPIDGRYTVALTASEGTIELPGFEGLMLDLDELWAEAGRLAVEDEDEPEAGDTRG